MPPAAAVLLTDARGRKALSAARALGRRRVRVLTCDSTRLVAARASRYVERHLVLPVPERDPEGFVAAVADLARREPGLVCFPLEDPTLEVLSSARDRLRDVRLPIAPSEAIAAALDKHAATGRAASLGLPVPRTVFPAGPEDMDRARALDFPVVVKPRRGWGAQGVTVVARRGDLDAAYQRAAAVFPRPFVQERVPPGGWAYGVSCLFNERGALRANFVHRRLREYPPGGGPSTLRASVLRPDLLEQSTRLLSALGWRGFAMVEWKTDPRDGTTRFLEVSPRFVGSLELAVQCGVDFPSLLYDVATTGDCTEVRGYTVGQLCRWLLPGDLLHFLANPGRWHLQPSFFRFRDPSLSYDDWARDDPWPSLAQVGVLALRALWPPKWRDLRRRSGALPP
jgi:predicted ATP-grasp superfamily ATP-dependent carboligase